MRQLFGFFGVLLTALAVLAANLDEPTGFRVNPTASMGPAIAAALCFVSEATLATAQIRTGLHREPEPPRR
jgi:glycerol uptake facilitator-like aquaporin